MSNWMFSRGARKFLFIGRSGLKRQAARDLVNDLEKRGAEVIRKCGRLSGCRRGSKANQRSYWRCCTGCHGACC